MIFMSAEQRRLVSWSNLTFAYLSDELVQPPTSKRCEICLFSVTSDLSLDIELKNGLDLPCTQWQLPPGLLHF